MTARSPRPATPRPQPTSATTLSLRSSTAGWYAEWKAKKSAAPAPAAETAPPDAAAEALARWLAGDGPAATPS